LLSREIFAWFVVYLIITGSLSTAFAASALIYTFFPTKLIEDLLYLFSKGIPLILMGIGIVSLLPLSEYTYTRQAGTNPLIARESVKHQKRKREKRELGILLGIAGMTSILGIDPWNTLFFLLSPPLGIPTVTLLMATTLTLLTIAYRKKMKSNLSQLNNCESFFR